MHAGRRELCPASAWRSRLRRPEVDPNQPPLTASRRCSAIGAVAQNETAQRTLAFRVGRRSVLVCRVWRAHLCWSCSLVLCADADGAVHRLVSRRRHPMISNRGGPSALLDRSRSPESGCRAAAAEPDSFPPGPTFAPAGGAPWRCYIKRLAAVDLPSLFD